MNHIHNVIEIGHILRQLKRKMVMIELLVVDDAFDGVADPSVAVYVHNLILDAHEHRDWDLRYG